MCFSAEMSFGAGTALITTGIVALRISRPNQIMFAMIPLLFGIQQVSEGMVWLSHLYSMSPNMSYFFGKMYLIFAFIVWPIWIPISVYFFNKNAISKRLVNLSIIIGTTVSVYLGFVLFYNGLITEIVCYHIKYHVDYTPPFKNHSTFIGISYLASLVIPTCFNKVNFIKVFGLFLIASYFLSRFFYANYFTSVWCFFAALISFVVVFILYKSNKNQIEC